jgi:Tol biopolymer transport system component
MHRRTLTTLLLVGATAVTLIVAPAGARPRGVNGQITYDQIIDPTTGEKAVVIANPDGSNERVLVPANPVSCCADFSPDGSKLAFPYPTADGRIGTAIINADGSGYTPFTIPDPTLNVGCGTGSWSPDGKRLACETWDDTTTATAARNGIYTISSADGSGLRRVTANPLGGHDAPGSYSPNGKRLVFARSDSNGNTVGLFVINADGTHVRQITPPGTIIQAGNFGDWSPQGNEIIFSRHVTPDVPGSIWVIHANGTGLHEIHIQGLDCGASFSDPNAAGCHGVRWSPDGKKIIFSGLTAAGFNIYTANADGTGLRQVTFDGNGDDPAWGTHPLAP